MAHGATEKTGGIDRVLTFFLPAFLGSMVVLATVVANFDSHVVAFELFVFGTIFGFVSGLSANKTSVPRSVLV